MPANPTPLQIELRFSRLLIAGYDSVVGVRIQLLGGEPLRNVVLELRSKALAGGVAELRLDSPNESFRVLPLSLSPLQAGVFTLEAHLSVAMDRGQITGRGHHHQEVTVLEKPESLQSLSVSIHEKAFQGAVFSEVAHAIQIGQIRDVNQLISYESKDALWEPLSLTWTSFPVVRGLQPGFVFAQRFRLVRPLGQGGMGVVWLATDKNLKDREVALKFLPEDVCHDKGAIDDLRDEVLKARDLRHDNIVAIHDLIEAGGTAAISMEYIDGPTLDEHRRGMPGKILEAEDLQPLLRQACHALVYAHDRQPPLIHHDIKPLNFMLTSKGVLKLCDFGLSGTLCETRSRLSGRNHLSGTTLYMSPQQLLAGSRMPADDIYSLGATLYELLTGKPPFYIGDVTQQIERTVPPTVMERRHVLGKTTGRTVPAELSRLVQQCLEKEPARRPASAAAVLQTIIHLEQRLEREQAQAEAAARKAGESRRLAQAAAAKKSGPLSPLSGTQAPGHPKTTLGAQGPAAAAGTSPAPPAPVPLRGLSGPLWAAAALVIVTIGAWAFFSKPKEITKEIPKLVDSTAAKQSGPLSGLSGPLSATKDAPFTNSLGMKFVPVPIGAGPSQGKRVLFSIWETRSKDYAVFVKESGHDAGEDWKTHEYEGVPVGRGEGEKAEDSSHPVANVSHDDAVAFCKWLTQKDRASGQIGPQDEYRLPSDVEWSYAVGIGEKEDASASPEDKYGNIPDVYPWGSGWPPPTGSGNYADTTAKEKGTAIIGIIEGYTDGHATTAPVGSFKKNERGLYDLGGNVLEWTNTPWKTGSDRRVLRGASWFNYIASNSLSSYRYYYVAGNRVNLIGFRCVLVVGGG
ncbi:MAG TPA: bifunctional serine/threonine-protein kinase/formylglycine-generating enzyme family protein [Prosthecobacter sp.]